VARSSVPEAAADRARESGTEFGARRSSAARPTAVREQVLTFTMGDQEVGVPILRVREIVESLAVHPLETTSPWIRGLTTIRSTTMPVVDLALKLGMPATSLTQRACFVVVEFESQSEPIAIAIMAETVSRVLDLAQVDLALPPVMAPQLQIHALKGVAKVGEELVLVLDVDQAIHGQELDQLLAIRRAATEATLPEAARPDRVPPETNRPQTNTKTHQP